MIPPATSARSCACSRCCGASPAFAAAPRSGVAAIEPHELRRRGFAALRALLGRLAAQPRRSCWSSTTCSGATPTARCSSPISAHHPGDARLLTCWRTAPRRTPAWSAQVRVGVAAVWRAATSAAIELGPLPPAERARAGRGARRGDGERRVSHACATPAGTRCSSPSSRSARRGRDAADARRPARPARIGAAVGGARRRVLRGAPPLAARPLPLEQAARVAGLGDAAGEMALLRAERLATVTQAGSGESLLEPYHDRVRAARGRAMSAELMRDRARGAGAATREEHAGRRLDALVVHWLGAERFERAARLRDRGRARPAERRSRSTAPPSSTASPSRHGAAAGESGARSQRQQRRRARQRRPPRRGRHRLRARRRAQRRRRRARRRAAAARAAPARRQPAPRVSSTGGACCVASAWPCR